MKWLSVPSISKWITGSAVWSTDKKYRHSLLREMPQHRDEFLKDMCNAVQQAHDDARRILIEMWTDPLDPPGASSLPKPIQNYPRCLDTDSLKGCFGEIMTAVVVRNLSPLGINDWHVPAFLFRFDDLAFDQIAEEILSGAAKKTPMPGHHGDDCLAFRRNAAGEITASLVCEAKCTADHSSTMVKQAHERLSKGRPRSMGIWRVLQVLRNSNEPDSAIWAETLTKFVLRQPVKGYERCDLVCYVYGRPPIKTPSWIPRDKPHSSYAATRRLEVVEIGLDNVEDLVERAYGKDA